MKTYVFEGTEVKKTGRVATRTVKVGATTRQMVLVEVTPVSDFDWKKWTSEDQLYEIVSGQEWSDFFAEPGANK